MNLFVFLYLSDLSPLALPAVSNAGGGRFAIDGGRQCQRSVSDDICNVSLFSLSSVLFKCYVMPAAHYVMRRLIGTFDL